MGFCGILGDGLGLCGILLVDIDDGSRYLIDVWRCLREVGGEGVEDRIVRFMETVKLLVMLLKMGL